MQASEVSPLSIKTKVTHCIVGTIRKPLSQPRLTKKKFRRFLGTAGRFPAFLEHSRNLDAVREVQE